MNAKTRSYIEIMMEILSGLVNDEPEFIKRKAELFLDPSSNEKKLLKIINEQKDELLNFIRHVHSFEEHKSLILHEVFSDLALSREERDKFETFLTKEDNLFIFLLNHLPTYVKIFDEQIQSLTSIGRIKRLFIKVESKLAKEDPKTIFLKFLKQEEKQYYELLELFQEFLAKLPEHREHIEFFENYEKITNNIGKVALAITAVPLGPLELLSAPFWLAYFGGKKMEKHLKYYEEYKRTQQHPIVDYVISLSSKD